MPTGYVMDFSNRTFEEFIYDSVKINIYSEKYFYDSGSKANRLRAFIKEESNYKVGQLLSALLDYWHTKAMAKEYGFDFEKNESIYKECLKIASRLKEETIIEEIDTIKEAEDDRDFSLLAKSIKESINKDEPEVALDRLHTYLIKFIRQLCLKHKIELKKEESLNAIYGKYIKFLISNELLESKMSENILKNLNPSELGKRIRIAREKSEITQAAAAEIIGAARTTMVAIEKGNRQIKPKELFLLSRAFNLTVSDLLNEKEIPNSFNVQYRASFKRSKKENEEIESVIEGWQKLCLDYLDLENKLNKSLPKNYPSEYKSPRSKTKVVYESWISSFFSTS